MIVPGGREVRPVGPITSRHTKEHDVKYLISIYGSYEAWDALEQGDIDARDRAHQAVRDELASSGELVDSNQLDVEGAKIVRTSQGARLVTDGPFTEAKELVGGYYIVDCASEDRAVEIAAKFVEAEYAPIEVRRLMW
jgi:hypothetical protein